MQINIKVNGLNDMNSHLVFLLNDAINKVNVADKEKYNLHGDINVLYNDAETVKFKINNATLELKIKFLLVDMHYDIDWSLHIINNDKPCELISDGTSFFSIDDLSNYEDDLKYSNAPNIDDSILNKEIDVILDPYTLEINEDFIKELLKDVIKQLDSRARCYYGLFDKVEVSMYSNSKCIAFKTRDKHFLLHIKSNRKRKGTRKVEWDLHHNIRNSKQMSAPLIEDGTSTLTA